MVLLYLARAISIVIINAKRTERGFMDRLSFIVEMTKALAWPSAIIAVVLLFRKSILSRLPSLTQFKYDKLEMQFREEVAAVQREVNQQVPAGADKSGEVRARPELLELAMTSPEGAVLEAWRYLELKLVEASDRNILDLAPAVRTMPMVQAALLHKIGFLSDAQLSLVQRLRALRHLAGEFAPGKIEIEQAQSFVDSVTRLAAFLSTSGTTSSK